MINFKGHHIIVLKIQFTDSLHYYFHVVSNSSFECQTGDIRLAGGDTPNEGRVEICVNGEWGTICDDGWGTPEAMVVCNITGFGTEGGASIL